MHHPTAPIIPILNKSYLFVHTPSDSQNPNGRYLQCPATGHLYCTSTGSLYPKTIIPLSVNISPLLSINSGLLPRNPTPRTMKTSSVCTNNINQQDNGASTRSESNTSPKAKDVKQPIQGNNASMSNTVPSVKNADQKMQGTSAPKTNRNKASDTTAQVISPVQGATNSSTGHLYCTSTGSLYQNTIIPLIVNSSPLLSINSGLLPRNPTPCTMKTSSVCTNNINQQNSGAKDVKQPIQGNNASMSNTVPSVKNADQQMQGTSVPKTHSNKPSDTTAQVNSPVQGASNSSACSQSNSEATTKKEKKKRSRKTKNKSVPVLDNSSATPKKKASVSNKKKKSTVTPQPKSTPSFVFIRHSSSNLWKPASITQTANQCKAVIRPDHNLSEKNTKKSHTYYTFYLHHMVKFIQPIQINFEDLLFPQNVSLKCELTKFSRKRAEENTQIIKVCSLSIRKYQRSPKRRRKPPPLRMSNEESFLLYSENKFKEKTERKKKLGPFFQVFKFKTADDILTMISNDLY